MAKRILVFLLTLALLLGAMTGLAEAAEVPEASEGVKSEFAQALEARYVDPDRVYSSDVRWWQGSASATDDTLMEEIQALYDGGFRGAELCMQADGPDELYAYGSDMWSHKWKLMMNKLLDLGMSVYLTSGTNWSTTNVPESYMSPASQQAMQIIAMPAEDKILAAGESVDEPLALPETVRENCALVNVYAYEIDPEGNVLYGTDIDLCAIEGAVTQDGEEATAWHLTWTAPEAGEQGADARFLIIPLWTQGSYQSSSPGVEPCYATNYFDKRGVEVLKTFWGEHYLNDEELVEKIKNGDVQLFMDSIELTYGDGFAWWCESAREEFQARKGYDILPYIFLLKGVGDGFELTTVGPYQETKGDRDLVDNATLREKIINDWIDVMTQLYEECQLIPLKEWLNGYGIKTRAQISYGKTFEITEPSVYVDYPEAENLNQYNQPDIFRLHTAGSKLQNKVLSTETGGTNKVYGTSTQRLLKDVYIQYATGFQRVVWHIWTAGYGYGNWEWPGYFAGFGGAVFFNRWSTREPSAALYDEFNAHISRVQQLMREGKSRTDIGFIHNNWTQGVKSGGENNPPDLQGMNWKMSHMGIYYRSTELQDHGYSYDYLSPDLLSAEGVYFDPETRTIELAGYKALVIYQRWLDADGALKILEWAEQGLPVVILEHAAQATPFNDGRDEELAETIAKLTALDNVRVAQINGEAEDFDYFDMVADGYDDDVYEAMVELGVEPYAGYPEANHQLLTQTREDEDGNRYLYVYNYCSNDYHEHSAIESVRTEDHGISIQTEILVDGEYVPYAIDAWTGEVTELGAYRHEDGKTVIPVDLTYGNIAMYAFENAADDKLHVETISASQTYDDGAVTGVWRPEAFIKDGALVIRATGTGDYTATLSNGETFEKQITVPEAYDITDWSLTVQAWDANPESGDLVREETIGDVTTVNRKTSTVVTEIPVTLETLTTWDNIPEVGKEVSGVGLYEASFNWDASAADGAYIYFGDTLEQTMVVWINDQKVGGGPTANPTKAQKSVGVEIGDGKGGTFVPEGKVLSTGGINWDTPIADITPYLVDGENTIRIEYRSNLTNITLAKGIINVQIFGQGSGWAGQSWWGYDVDYRAYGPQAAIIVPFVDAVVE